MRQNDSKKGTRNKSNKLPTSSKSWKMDNSPPC